MPLRRAERDLASTAAVLASSSVGEEREKSDTALLDAPGAADEAPVPEPEWRTILYNDDDHTMEEVERQLQRATGCSLEIATHITTLVHTEGRATAFTGTRAECERVAGILRQIDLRVDVEQQPAE